MSSASQETHVEILGKLGQEIRKFSGLSSSYFRMAATRIGLAVTDLQVMDILDLTGGTSAGRLAEVTGLTTGAITRILTRLEEAGLVGRERDRSDGRRVIVRLEKGKGELLEVRSILNSTAKAWNEVAAHYDTEQLAFFLEFLQQGNEMSRKEILRLQEASPSEGAVYSAPLADLESGRLLISSGISRLTVRADERIAELYQARFEGPIPDVKVKEGVVTIRYPRRLLGLGGKQGAAEVALGVTLPWWIVFKGGAAEIVGNLQGLNLAGLEVKGGFSKIHLELPIPSGVVPIRIMGGAPEIILHRPGGVATQIHLKGWVSELVFDDQTLSGAGNTRLQSSGYDPTSPGYAIEVTSYASRVAITSA